MLPFHWASLSCYLGLPWEWPGTDRSSRACDRPVCFCSLTVIHACLIRSFMHSFIRSFVEILLSARPVGSEQCCKTGIVLTLVHQKTRDNYRCQVEGGQGRLQWPDLGEGTDKPCGYSGRRNNEAASLGGPAWVGWVDMTLSRRAVGSGNLSHSLSFEHSFHDK